MIHQRYEDAALVIFRQDQKKSKEPANYPVFGETTQHHAFTRFGNATVIMKKSGRDVTKKDERAIQSQFCVVM